MCHWATQLPGSALVPGLQCRPGWDPRALGAGMGQMCEHRDATRREVTAWVWERWWVQDAGVVGQRWWAILSLFLPLFSTSFSFLYLALCPLLEVEVNPERPLRLRGWARERPYLGGSGALSYHGLDFMFRFYGQKAAGHTLFLDSEKKVKVKSPSPVWLFVTPWTVAHQPPPSMGFSRQEY